MTDTLSPPAPTKGELTRTTVLDAAHSLFLDHGYHGTSMRQIALGAGLALGGIYNHFPNKEAIFVAVLEAYHPYTSINAALQSAQGETPTAYFHDAAQRIVAALEGNPRFFNLALIEFVEFEGRHIPAIAQRVLPELVGAFASTSRFQAHYRAVPPPVMMRSFLGLFFSYYLTENLIPKELLAQFQVDWVQGLLDVYLHGILMPSAEEKHV